MSAPVDVSGTAGDRRTDPLDGQADLRTLLARFTRDVGELMSSHVRLAAAELRQEARDAMRAARVAAAAAAVGALAVVLLSFALAWALGDWLDAPAIGFLIVGGGYAVLAVAMALAARQEVRDVDVVPTQTATTIEEDIAWIRSHDS